MQTEDKILHCVHHDRREKRGCDMAIPAQFIDELNARTDLVDLVGEYVRLNKKGGSYWGCCPFHGEKTPSFHVVPDRQIYKCFGCGKGGGATSFIMEQENLSFPDAVAFLAKRAGMQMPEQVGERPGARERREKLIEINRQAAKLFHSWLYQPEGEHGLDYLKHRGLSQNTLTRFGLGFAPNRWDGLIVAMAQLGYDKRDLLDAGLAVSNKDGRIYDRFRNRVMFPIIDVRGSVIGFGGRVMDDSTPKYLNSPDTAVYNKSRNLFALNIAKKSKSGKLILTEGYMDTIALHQAGFDGGIASLGTALTPEHAQLIARYTGEVLLSYDGDKAGVAAAQRSIPILEKVGLKVRVLRMQGAKDPDEFIKTFGRDSFARLLDQSENHIDYRIAQIRQKFQLEDDSQRIEFLKEATSLLASLRSAVEREIYGKKVADMAGISSEAVASEVKKELYRRINKEKKQQERRDLTPATQLQPRVRAFHYDNIRSARGEEGVVRILALDATLVTQTTQLAAEEFSSPLLGRAYGALCQRYHDGLAAGLNGLTPHFTSEEMNHLAQVVGEVQDMTATSQALSDYIAIIHSEAHRRTQSDDEQLLAIQQRLKQKKAYMEDNT